MPHAPPSTVVAELVDQEVQNLLESASQGMASPGLGGGSAPGTAQKRVSGKGGGGGGELFFSPGQNSPPPSSQGIGQVGRR
jgi:hypothetical protein